MNSPTNNVTMYHNEGRGCLEVYLVLGACCMVQIVPSRQRTPPAFSLMVPNNFTVTKRPHIPKKLHAQIIRRTPPSSRPEGREIGQH